MKPETPETERSSEQTPVQVTHATAPTIKQKMRAVLDAIADLEGEEIEYRTAMVFGAAGKEAREYLKYADSDAE